MAPRRSPWDALDLRSNYVEAQLRARWGGPKAFFKTWNNMITGYQDSWNIMAFLFSSPNMEDDLHWEVVKPLGAGGFGKVGLWQARQNEDGLVVDEIAIKQAQRVHNGYDCHISKPGLAGEAWLQNQFNQNDCDKILYLRRYKFYQHGDLYRFYMEYCPHGDLDRLRYRYRAFKKYLPELFLWHLFSALAIAGRSMDQGPFINPENDKIHPEDWYMLHMDLKTSNVFLGYTAEENDVSIDPTLTSRYPSIKVSDFGLAGVTGVEDDTNVRNFWVRGTPDFQPPEQRVFGYNWQRPPNLPSNYKRQASKENAKVEAEQNLFQFDLKHNIWAIGKIMNDMITLNESDKYDATVDLITETEYFKDNYGTKNYPEIGTKKEREYSRELLDLVSECLRIDRQYRPKSDDLLRRVENGREKYQETTKIDLEQRGLEIGLDNEVLYFRRNEINNLRETSDDHDFPYIPGDWQRVVLSRYQDPTWTTVNPKSAFRRTTKFKNDYLERYNFQFPALPGYVQFGGNGVQELTERAPSAPCHDKGLDDVPDNGYSISDSTWCGIDDDPGNDTKTRSWNATDSSTWNGIDDGTDNDSNNAINNALMDALDDLLNNAPNNGASNVLDNASTPSAAGSDNTSDSETPRPTPRPGPHAVPVPVQPPIPVFRPAPMLADYQAMRVPELHAELTHRGIARGHWGRLKVELIARLQQADTADNRGNGAPRAEGPLRKKRKR